MMETCPLCYTESFNPEIVGPKGRMLHFFDNCKLVFEERINRPGWQEEKERYLEHENGIQYKGYVNHLNQAINPALCFEHFFRPANELHKLWGLLKPRGFLVVMTQLWKDTTNFKTWVYAQFLVMYHLQNF